jgi:hypothetical protein
MISTVRIIKARDSERHAFCRVEVEASHNMWTASHHLIISGFGTHTLIWLSSTRLGSAWLMRMHLHTMKHDDTFQISTRVSVEYRYDSNSYGYI